MFLWAKSLCFVTQNMVNKNKNARISTGSLRLAWTWDELQENYVHRLIHFSRQRGYFWHINLTKLTLNFGVFSRIYHNQSRIHWTSCKFGEKIRYHKIISMHREDRTGERGRQRPVIVLAGRCITVLSFFNLSKSNTPRIQFSPVIHGDMKDRRLSAFLQPGL